MLISLADKKIRHGSLQTSWTGSRRVWTARFDYDAFLRELIVRAIETAEIVAGLKAARMTGKEMEDVTLGQREEILATISAERSKLDADLHSLASSIQTLDPGQPPPPTPSTRRSVLTWLAGLAALTSIVITTFSWLGPFATSLSGLRIVGAITIVLMTIIWLSLFAAGLPPSVDDEHDYMRMREHALLAPVFQRIRARIAEVDRALFERGVLEFMRDSLNRRISNSYETKLSLPVDQARGIYLRVDVAPGLHQLPDERFEIPTSASRQVQNLMSRMAGGSIGISGARGVGKTTLIRSICTGRFNSPGDRPPILTVLVSAPVEYTPRDFLLHLFAEVCRAVETTFPTPARPSATDLARAGLTVGWQLLRLYVVILLVLVGLVASTGRLTSTSTAQLLLAVAGITGLLAIAGGFNRRLRWLTLLLSRIAVGFGHTLLGWSALKRIGRTLGRAAGWLRSVFQSSGPVVYPLPGSWYTFAGLVLGIGAVIGLLPGRLVAFSRDWGWAVGVAIALYLVLVHPVVVGRRRASLPLIETRHLSTVAHEHLRRIRYQLSYTSGWSGGLKVPALWKLPLAVEAGLARGWTLAEVQHTLPQVVTEFIEFVRDIATIGQGSVVIAIDELDKIESDVAARQFLNDVKAVFGIRSTFFLIAVSEDALASFERRGMPFRDVFDSSFDEIIRVDHLSFVEAKQLINRRVLGLPVAFIALAFVVSGGLARDFVRATRSMIELPDGSGLSHVSACLIRRDLVRKTSAALIAAGRRERGLDEFVRWCAEVTPQSVDAAVLLAHAKDGLRRSLPSSDGDAHQNEVSRLMRELATYEYFGATVMEFFCDELSRERIEAAESTGAGSYDQLARAWQSFSTSASLAYAMVDTFRQASGISPLAAQQEGGADLGPA